jgi:hypothetical protein
MRRNPIQPDCALFQQGSAALADLVTSDDFIAGDRGEAGLVQQFQQVLCAFTNISTCRPAPPGGNSALVSLALA